MRRITFALFFFFISVLFVSANVFASTYSSDWTMWSQDESNDQTTRDYGCLVVALARVLAASGVETSPSFNPDVFRDWEYSNGFLNQYYYQIEYTRCLTEYASQKGKSITYVGGNTGALWDYINNDYYAIVQYNSGTATGHWVLICNQKSRETGHLYCYQSGHPGARGIQPMPTEYVLNVIAWNCEETIYIDPVQKTLSIGESFETASSTTGLQSRRIEWTSSNPNVAVVNETGTVSAVSAGEAVITAKLKSVSANCAVKVKSASSSDSSIILSSPSKIKLNKGDKYQISVTAPGSGGAVKWSSSKPGVASISRNGLVTAKKSGTAVITAKCGKKSVKVNVTVVNKSLKLSKQKLTLRVGEKRKLTAKVSGVSKTVTWTSSNTNVAKVSKGVITASGCGFAFITATANGITKKCTVYVQEQKSISLNTTSLSLAKGKTYTLKATIKGMRGKIKWSTSNKNVVTVSNGKIKGIKKGKAIITASCGGLKARCVVTVKQSSNWKKIYNEFLSKPTQDGGEFDFKAEKFYLYDLNEDGIPELITLGGGNMDWYKVFTIKSGKIRNIWVGTWLTIYRNGICEEINHIGMADLSNDYHTFSRMDKKTFEFKEVFVYVDWYDRGIYTAKPPSNTHSLEESLKASKVLSKSDIDDTVNRLVGTEGELKFKFYENSIANRKRYL